MSAARAPLSYEPAPRRCRATCAEATAPVSRCRVTAPWNRSCSLGLYRLSSLTSSPTLHGRTSCNVVVTLSANLKDNDTCDASDRQLIARQMLTDGTERTIKFTRWRPRCQKPTVKNPCPSQQKRTRKRAHATFCLEWPRLKWRFCRYVDKEFSERIQR